MVDVVVNGETKGTLYIPATDPTYVVTVGEAARSIVFRHISGGRVTITRVDATLSVQSVSPYDQGGGLGSDGQAVAADVSYEVINLMDAFFEHAHTSDWENVLLPVKIKAGRAYAQATASGDLSGRVREAMVGLQVQMDMAESTIEKGFHDPAMFDHCVQFLTLKNKIRDLLD
jgi:hypothetical protein